MELHENRTVPPCLGQVYRAAVTTFRTDRGIRKNLSMNRLRRLSCRGEGTCPRCAAIQDMVNDSGSLEHLEFPEDPQNGSLWRLQVIVDGTDRETGWADEWHLAFRAVPEPEKKEAKGVEDGTSQPR